jgi:signal transduction histidine kinase
VRRFHRCEEVSVREEALRAAQEQVAAIVQRVVEARQDPRLRLGVEVHERVAAGEQLQP